MDYNVAKAWLDEHCHRSIRSDVEVEEFILMETLLKNHPDYSGWLRKDVEYFKITRAPKKKHLQVYMKMEGVSRPRLVSWTACVTGKKRKTNNLTAAMRTTIIPQIEDWNMRHPSKTCALCGSGERIEVDHYPKKFREIKKEFLNQNVEDIPPLYFLRNKWIFSNKVNNTFAENWYEFHLQHATYRFLCEKCNMREK